MKRQHLWLVAVVVAVPIVWWAAQGKIEITRPSPAGALPTDPTPSEGAEEQLDDGLLVLSGVTLFPPFEFTIDNAQLSVNGQLIGPAVWEPRTLPNEGYAADDPVWLCLQAYDSYVETCHHGETSEVRQCNNDFARAVQAIAGVASIAPGPRETLSVTFDDGHYEAFDLFTEESLAARHAYLDSPPVPAIPQAQFRQQMLEGSKRILSALLGDGCLVVMCSGELGAMDWWPRKESAAIYKQLKAIMTAEGIEIEDRRRRLFTLGLGTLTSENLAELAENGVEF
ncbi:MAG: hypothetical protein AAF581_07410 [Planctomycetota bacterium]